jgi:FkbM family methyltransferase
MTDASLIPSQESGFFQQLIRKVGRTVFRVWNRLEIAPGYLYQAIDQYGASLGELEPLMGQLPNGCKVYCKLSDHVQRQMWFYGVYEPVESYLYSQLLKPGMVVLDVGANIGQYTLLAAKAISPGGCVHSFEPIPSNFAQLKKHVQENQISDLVRLNQAALWNEDARVQLAMPAHVSNNAGAFSIGVASEKGAEPFEATAVRMDTYWTQNKLKRLDLIKMDIEGAEPFALEGGLEIISQFKPIILMEICKMTLQRFGKNASAIWGPLTDLGYKAWRIGFSADTSGPVQDFKSLEQCNVFFYQGELPASFTQTWTLRTALRWARKRLQHC